MLKNIKFETSVFSKDKIVKTDLPQIVLVGKSNVGKSSFINKTPPSVHTLRAEARGRCCFNYNKSA